MPDKSETIFVKSEINQKFKVWIVGRIITGARVDTLPDKSETIPINQKNFKTKKLAQLCLEEKGYKPFPHW